MQRGWSGTREVPKMPVLRCGEQCSLGGDAGKLLWNLTLNTKLLQIYFCFFMLVFARRAISSFWQKWDLWHLGVVGRGTHGDHQSLCGPFSSSTSSARWVRQLNVASCRRADYAESSCKFLMCLMEKKKKAIVILAALSYALQAYLLCTQYWKNIYISVCSLNNCVGD